MIVQTKPKLDQKLKILFDKLLGATEKTMPMHHKFIKTLDVNLRDLFMQYFSYIYKYDLKEYELMKRRNVNNDKRIIDGILQIILDYKDSEIWKTDHVTLVRGVTLGAMYQIQYRSYRHDPFPLALFLNSFDQKHQNFQAINLHYLMPSFREFFISKVLSMNSPRIASDKLPILTLDMVKQIIPDLGLAYRNYKAEEIKVIERIHHTRWNTYMKIDGKYILS